MEVSAMGETEHRRWVLATSLYLGERSHARIARLQERIEPARRSRARQDQLCNGTPMPQGTLDLLDCAARTDNPNRNISWRQAFSKRQAEIKTNLQKTALHDPGNT
jgi:hypothetical protein